MVKLTMLIENAAKILNLCEIPFEYKHNGLLLVYQSIYFYPKTGTFYDKKLKVFGSSLWSLFCHIIDTQEISTMQQITITVAIEELVS